MFCNQLLRNDPSQRLGSNNISEIKNHPWFADINWKDYKAHNINPPTIPHVTTDPSRFTKIEFFFFS